MSRYFGTAFVLGLAAVAVADPFAALPRTEQEAEAMLADGSLDAAIWARVEPLYDQPLAVAEGELRYLADLFPGAINNPPVSSAQLARYEPWDALRIRRFFADHPDLVAFQPVLDFTPCSARHLGTVSLRVRQNPLVDTVAVLSRFDLGVGRRLAARGSVAISPGTARWNRRSLACSVPAIGDVTVGNFSQRWAEGLAGGYFRSTSGAGDDESANWLYGSTRSWNGAQILTPLPRDAELATFAHARPGETMAGMQAEIPVRYVKTFAGGTVGVWDVDSLTAADTTVVAHAGVEVNAGPWRAGGWACLDGRTPASIPFAVRAAHRAGAATLDVRVVRIPRGFRLPLSGLQRALSWRLTQEESAMVDDITDISIETAYCAADRVTLSPTLSYVTNRDRSRLDASLTARGSVPLDYRVRYAWQPASGDLPSHHTAAVSAGRGVGSHWYVAANGRVTGDPDSRAISSLLTASVDWRALGGMHLAPLVSVASATGRETEVTGGLRQSVDLFEKTRGEFVVEAPVSPAWDRELLLSGRLVFFF